MSFAIVFPGQGSQSIGMLNDIAFAHKEVESLFSIASEVVGIDLWQLCQQGPIETLSKTQYTQPALLTAGVAAWQVWKKLGGADPVIMAGHSLGEYTALTCAGAMEFVDAVSLVHDRGHYMQAAVPEGEGAMAAILGLDDDKVIEICEQVNKEACLQAVNFNAPGQVVIAGKKTAILQGIELLKAAGARRAVLLPVSIPAHSQLMTPASKQLANRIACVKIQKPSINVLHNVDVSVAQNVSEISEKLILQLDSPVRWVESMQKIHLMGVNQFVESGPGRVLCGMIKRIAPVASSFSLDKLDSYKQVI